MAALFQVFSFVLIFGSAWSIFVKEPIQLTEPYQIGPYFINQRSLFENSGVISGVRNCGGSGRMLKFRYEKCTTGLPPPCTFPSNSNGRSELVFIPSVDSDGLGIRTTITTLDGEVKAYENPLPETSVLAGKEYVFNAAGGVSDELRGKQFISKVEIYSLNNRQVDVCAEADFYAV